MEVAVFEQLEKKIEKLIEQCVELKQENKKLTETLKKLEERVENLSILFFHLKDEMVKNNTKHS